MTVVLAVGFGALVAAVALAVVSARASAVGALAGSILLAVAGIDAAVGGAHPTLDIGAWLGFGPSALAVDGLAGIFLGLTGVTAAAVSFTYVERAQKRLVAALHGLIVLATATAVCANQAFLFFLAWELLTVAIYLVASSERERPGTLLAGYFTGALTKVGGGALLAAIGLLYGQTGSFEFGAWAHAAATMDPTVRGVAFALFVIAFGTKLGVLPLQGAVPVGYSAAPAAAAATISVALCAGFYGLWRLVFDVLGPAQLWWGELLLIVGGLTAFAGVLYAIAQDELRRFLGFSTIEHTGIALIGFGVALVGQAEHQPKIAAAGMLAATLHVIAHGLSKTLAFLAIERVEAATGAREMRPLGGLARVLPRTAGGFGIATLTLAAIPPFGGFVSEWLTFQSLLQAFRLDTSFTRLLMAIAAALLAITAALGLLAFAKIYGFVFLGHARSAIERVREPVGGVGLTLLAIIVFALGVAAPWEIHLIGSGLSATLGFDLASEAITHPLVLGPVFAKFSVLAPTWLYIVLPAYALTAALLARLVYRPKVRREPVWVTGTEADLALSEYTPAGYSNPIRVVMQGPYGYERTLEPGPPDRSGIASTLVLETRVVLAVEQYVYRPIAALALAASGRVKRLQSGRLGSYMLYLLLVLLLLLALIPTLQS
jgi:hydrogenase-4 component B